MFYLCTQWTCSARGTKIEEAEGKDEHIEIYENPSYPTLL